MTIFERVETVRRLWAVMIPHVSLPSDTWMTRWCAGFPDAVIEMALAQTSKKFPSNDVPHEQVHRYATSTMRHAAERLRTGREAA